MSTKIKNTLFRFVTMRAPELSNEDGIKTRFVFMEPRINAAEVRTFEDYVNANHSATVSKWQAMVNCSENFIAKTENEIKLFNLKIYEFGVWIARNKHSYTHEELKDKADSISSHELTVDQVNLLWDNLFYQVITKKDFYAKEAIIQVLIANHVLENLNQVKEDVEIAKQIVSARVVLPKDLFVENDGQTNGSISKTSVKSEDQNQKFFVGNPNEEMSKQVENYEAKIKIESALKLKKELEKAERKYKIEYKEAYHTALKNHNIAVKPLIEQYEALLQTEKENWCSTKDPNVPYDPNDPCNQPNFVPKPILPEFNFSYKSEMELSSLDENLSDESYKLLLHLLEIEYTVDGTGKADPLSITDDSGISNTFEQTYSLVNNVVSQNSQIISNNTTTQGKTVVSVGGVIVLTSTQARKTPFSFQICPKIYDENTGFYITIEVPDSTWVFNEQGSYNTLQRGALNSNHGLSYVSRTDNSFLLKTNDDYPSEWWDEATGIYLHMIFNNGVKAVTVPSSSGNSIFRTCVDGLALTPGSNGNSSGNGSSSSQTQTNFIPSGFGFKQIGIADYKKVEQTTQGYVEGDVAHIENIMAREYKEKATRRLRRSENTTTSSSESEKEKLTDTTSTDRFEMQSEVAKVLQEANDFAAGAQATYSGGNKNAGTAYSIGGNVNMATHSSNEESSMNAVNHAKEITERAMERIVTKVKEVRIEKIIEEFEENNKHGFDNTKGDKHVVGVYRWVDKVYKNQVYNFGKRLMFEFMIPQPSKLHIFGMSENQMLTKLVEPIDPRKYEDDDSVPENEKLNLKDFSRINEKTLKHWAGLYNVEFSKLGLTKTISDSYSVKESTGPWSDSSNKNIAIPEGYKAVEIKGNLTFYPSGDDDIGTNFATLYNHNGHVSVCGNLYHFKNIQTQVQPAHNTENNRMPFVITNLSVEDNISLTVSTWDIGSFATDLLIKCEATEALKQKLFNTIIDAYEDALVEYNQKLAEENALGVKIKGENPGFYRQIENLILRKNCISYMINQDQNAARTYGKNMFKPLGTSINRTFKNHEVNVSADLDDYSAFAKFMEQAFEWEIMSYNFYPYYWGNREDWGSLYQYDNNDPLFRNFMQAGMARVIVTVRPGFEEAVRFYMQTGEIWNGGEVPVIEDKLFLSLVDELRTPKGKKEGKAWATRLPTALTILQADSIGLKVTKALLFDQDALPEFENPSEVPVSEGLEITYDTLGSSQLGRILGRIFGNENKEAKIVLKNYLDDTLRDLTYCDANGNWELNSVPVGKYKLVLDANNDFPTTDYEVTEGSKEVTVELAADQTAEINLTIQPLT